MNSVNKNYKKPRLGQKVYTIYITSISLTKANYIGKDSFIVENHEYKRSDAREYFYKNFNETWFTSLAKAKKQLLENYPDSVIVKEYDDYWEAYSND